MVRLCGELRVYVGEYADSCSVGSPRKRGIDTVVDFKAKRFRCQVSKENGAG